MSGVVFWPNGSTTKPRITGGFGPREPFWTPGGTTYPFHYGTDMVGFSIICAPVDGVVTFAGYNGGFGNFVRIQGDNGDDYGHAHIAPNGFKVSRGDRVRRGQPIAIMGTTGKSTGVHLHWEVYRGRGSAVNAETYMQSNAAPAGGGSTPFNPEDEDMPITDDDARKIAGHVWGHGIGEDGTGGKNDTPAWIRLSFAHSDAMNSYRILRELSGPISAEVAGVPDDKTDGKLGVRVAWIDYQARAIAARMAGLEAAVTALAAAQGLDPEEIAATISKAVADALADVEITLATRPE